MLVIRERSHITRGEAGGGGSADDDEGGTGERGEEWHVMTSSRRYFTK